MTIFWYVLVYILYSLDHKDILHCVSLRTLCHTPWYKLMKLSDLWCGGVNIFMVATPINNKQMGASKGGVLICDNS